MTLYGWPIVFALVIWWFSTGAVMYLMGLPRASLRLSMGAISLLAAGALAGLWVTQDDTSIFGAYAAFASTLLVWAWHEMSFLSGLVTGPRTSALPKGTHGAARLMPAIETVIYHELALFLTLAALAFMTWGSENQVGLGTFGVLWVMRLSAKLNLFLGVPNLGERFLPDHLKYLGSYFRSRPMNGLFPISVMAATVGCTLLIQAATGSDASDFEAVGFTLVAALLGLALLEHWFMVVALPSELLFAWGLASREAPDARTDTSKTTVRLRKGKTCQPTAIA